jgi:hypothetical protein
MVIPLLEENPRPAMPAAAAGVTVIPFERAVRTTVQPLPAALTD